MFRGQKEVTPGSSPIDILIGPQTRRTFLKRATILLTAPFIPPLLSGCDLSEPVALPDFREKRPESHQKVLVVPISGRGQQISLSDVSRVLDRTADLMNTLTFGKVSFIFDLFKDTPFTYQGNLTNADDSTIQQFADMEIRKGLKGKNLQQYQSIMYIPAGAKRFTFPSGAIAEGGGLAFSDYSDEVGQHHRLMINGNPVSIAATESAARTAAHEITHAVFGIEGLNKSHGHDWVIQPEIKNNYVDVHPNNVIEYGGNSLLGDDTERLCLPNLVELNLIEGSRIVNIPLATTKMDVILHPLEYYSSTAPSDFRYGARIVIGPDNGFNGQTINPVNPNFDSNYSALYLEYTVSNGPDQSQFGIQIRRWSEIFGDETFQLPVCMQNARNNMVVTQPVLSSLGDTFIDIIHGVQVKALSSAGDTMIIEITRIPNGKSI